MRTKSVIISLLVLILLAALIPQIDADIQIHLPSQDEPTIEPIAMGNISNSYRMEQIPKDMCVTADGTIFTVNSLPFWDRLGPQYYSNSFIAWNSNGSVQWAKEFRNWALSLYGVITEKSHVYVTGYQGYDLYLGKYNFQGNCIWNRTWDAGNIECGFDIALIDDGSIMVSGFTKVLHENDILDFFLLCFDSQGELLWEKRSLITYRISCHSGFVYARYNDTLQKFRSDGSNVWSMDFDSGQFFITHDEIIFVGSYAWGASQAMVRGLSTINGTEIWSTNITFTDPNQEICDIYLRDYMITPDGSLLLLLGITNRTHYNLLKLDKSGALLWNFTIMDINWSYPIIRMKDENRLFFAGNHNQSSIGIAVFDLSSITEYTSTSTIHVYPLDIPMIGMTIVGVTLFNVGLIIFLKRRYKV